MCGRYRLSRRKQIIEEHFHSVPGTEDWHPRYNIAPTQPVPVIRQHPKEPVRELSLVRWGLVPSWAKDLSVAARMINARSETACTKPAFLEALKSRRLSHYGHMSTNSQSTKHLPISSQFRPSGDAAQIDYDALGGQLPKRFPIPPLQLLRSVVNREFPFVARHSGRGPSRTGKSVVRYCPGGNFTSAPCVDQKNPSRQ